jgi:hypothetical protein
MQKKSEQKQKKQSRRFDKKHVGTAVPDCRAERSPAPATPKKSLLKGPLASLPSAAVSRRHER